MSEIAPPLSVKLWNDRFKRAFDVSSQEPLAELKSELAYYCDKYGMQPKAD